VSTSAPALADVAAAIGHRARAAMLDAMLGARAVSAGELATAAAVAPSTASGHLEQLVGAGLVVCEPQGRQRRYALAGPAVAEALETLSALAAPETRVRSLREANVAEAMRAGRTCYDHLAGRLGVAVAEELVRRRWLVDADDSWAVAPKGERGLGALGIDVGSLRTGRRPLTRRCLDWTERRHHLAGALGAALADRAAELGWVVRVPGSRALRVTPAGERGLRSALGIEL
jgi:DNA-binding transcriptional ArsR family regulator